MTEPSGGSDKPRRPVAVPALALVALTAIGITALLGGLNETAAAPPPKVKAGQSFDQGQFETQFVESKLTVQRAQNQFAQDKRFLDVIFKVTNKTDATIAVGGLPSGKSAGFSFGRSLLKMTPEVKTKLGGRLFVTSKGVESTQLHPGIPSTVVARYELDATTEPPKEITFELGVYENVENPLTGESVWLLPTEGGLLDADEVTEVAATVTLPVKQEDA
ncbi:hypothetical protein [Nonomuraea sp. SBT364]|uniref:hypothetical protein n=1 Tax=Nonomuraea sp. SBT364 TaxID=1580530 RepID=UPI00066C73E4|nr:hypothetical protein [Nonomuraea sp. SBT364]